MPTGKKRKGRKPSRKTKPPGPLSSCKLPHDVVLNILSRLPVKTLLRFRCVCKPWKSLIRNPKLVNLHLSHHSSATTSPSLLLHSVDKRSLDNKLTLFSLHPSSVSSPTAVPHHFPDVFLEMDVVGTLNGIVCICQPPWGDCISLFNPATKHCKMIRPFIPYAEILERISVGFGYQPVTNEYWVIRISTFKKELHTQPQGEIYLCNSGSRRRFEVSSLRVRFVKTKCDAIVNGNPYWSAVIDDDYGGRDVFVWFNVHSEVICQMPAPVLGGSRLSNSRLVDWKGNVALLAMAEVSTFIDVWMLDDDGDGVEWWSKKCSVGPILGMSCLVGSSRNGQIVGEDGEGSLILYDHETGGVDKFGVDGNIEHKFAVFNYRESLVSLEGDMPMRLGKIRLNDYMLKLRKRTGSNAKVKSETNGDYGVVMPLENGFTMGFFITPSRDLFD